MPEIHTHALLHASQERVYSLVSSLDLYTTQSSETLGHPVAGLLSGQLYPGAEIVWRVRALGMWHECTLRVTCMQPPTTVCITSLDGPFRSLTYTCTITPHPSLHNASTLQASIRLASHRTPVHSLLGNTLIPRTLRHILRTHHAALYNSIYTSVQIVGCATRLSSPKQNQLY